MHARLTRKFVFLVIINIHRALLTSNEGLLLLRGSLERKTIDSVTIGSGACGLLHHLSATFTAVRVVQAALRLEAGSPPITQGQRRPAFQRKLALQRAGAPFRVVAGCFAGARRLDSDGRELAFAAGRHNCYTKRKYFSIYQLDR